MSGTWDGPLRALAERAIDDGLVEGAVFAKAKRSGWKARPMFLDNADLCRVLRESIAQARERGLVVEVEDGMVLQDGEGGRL